MASGMMCTHCGAALPHRASACPACGAAPGAPGAARRSRLLWWLAVGAAVAVAGPLLFLAAPALFFRIVAVLGVVMLVVSVVLMLLTFRKAKRVSPLALTISAALSVICMAVYAGFLGRAPGVVATVLSLLAGGAIGVAWSFTTHFERAGDDIRSRGGYGYLLLWAVVLALTQLVTIVTGRAPAAAMVLLMANTGLAVGNSGGLFARYLALRARPGVVP